MTSRVSPRQSLKRATETKTSSGNDAADGNDTGIANGIGNEKDKLGYFFQSQGFKRFSVYLSIGLSAASLIIGAVAQLMTLSPEQQRSLAVTGLVVNAISITLSALTSLDWRSEAEQDKKFLSQLFGLVQINDEGKVSLINQVP